MSEIKQVIYKKRNLSEWLKSGREFHKTCLACRRECKVLNGSAAVPTRFYCRDFEEKFHHGQS
jgi:hypothetical protein